MAMEASTTKSKPVTLALDFYDTKPGEIAFGKMEGDIFVGQRLVFRPLDANTRKVEVVVEDVESPVSDKETKTTTQLVHKKLITMEADGNFHKVEVNGKKLIFKVYVFGGENDDSNKVMIKEE